MSKYTNTLTEDATVYICDVHRRRDAWSWIATLYAVGTFGSGTIAWQWSPDGGTTKLALKDFSGVALTSTSNDSFNVQMGTGKNLTDNIKIYATLSGSTGPSITVGCFDNN